MAPSTKYCWIVELKKRTFLANSRESVRVMGKVTEVKEISSDDQQVLLAPLILRYRNDDTDQSEPESNRGLMDRSAKNKFLSVTMDDGTDSFEFWAPERMILSASLNIKLGQTYDCIMKLRQKSSEKQWFAETLIQIHNHIDEHYRWMELSHHDRFKSISKLPCSNLNHELGFPTRRRNAIEVHRLIRLNAQSQQQEHEILSLLNTPQKTGEQTQNNIHPKWRNNHQQQHSLLKKRNKCTHDKHYHQNSPTLKSPSQVQLEGILLEDLAIVLQKPQYSVREMIEGLQLEGKIYQNERGEYLPI